MAELVKDLVCGMEIDPETAAATSVYNGATYYFCAESCKQDFDADPGKYVQNGGGVASMAEPAGSSARPPRRWYEFWRR